MRRSLRGDTLIEVIFAISVFSLVAVLSIAAMNHGIETAQGSLEVTMARNEIDAQAEALRFIHNSFLSEREYTDSEQTYRNLWKRLSDTTNGGLANGADSVPDLTYSSCDEPYDTSKSGNISALHGFIVNTRFVNPNDVNGTILSYSDNLFTTSSLYPRLIYSNTTGSTNGSQNSDDDILATGQKYRKVARAEGIWIVSVAGVANANSVYAGVPEYYDFHIRTCWYAPGSSVPSTIGTIIRLYNPELVEVSR